MELIDLIAERLRTVAIRTHAWQFGNKATGAAWALKAARVDDKFAVVPETTQVASPANIPALTAGPMGPAQ